MPEERLHEGRQFLQFPKLAKECAFQLIVSENLLAANPVILYVVPNLFNRIEFRQVTGKRVDFQLAGKRINAFLHFL